MNLLSKFVYRYILYTRGIEESEQSFSDDDRGLGLDDGDTSLIDCRPGEGKGKVGGGSDRVRAEHEQSGAEQRVQQ